MLNWHPRVGTLFQKPAMWFQFMPYHFELKGISRHPSPAVYLPNPWDSTPNVYLLIISLVPSPPLPLSIWPRNKMEGGSWAGNETS